MNNFAEYIKKYTDGKTVCILGFGREGKSTYRILQKYCTPSAIAVADLNNVDRSANELPEEVELICGNDYQKTVLISVGRNRYGHPSESALARFAAIGAEVLRTDESGDLELKR